MSCQRIEGVEGNIEHKIHWTDIIYILQNANLLLNVLYVVYMDYLDKDNFIILFFAVISANISPMCHSSTLHSIA